MQATVLEAEIKWAGYSGQQRAINDISLTVKSGECVGLIGPNGAGKSTALKAIMGLLPAAQTSVRFTGLHGNYAYIPEQPLFYDYLTLQEHLELAAAAHGLAQSVFKQRSEELLTLFRLTEQLRHYPATFSKGMQQKTMLAVAFLIEPDLYLIDEPFIGLDPLAMHDLLELFTREKARGAGLLVSTHQLDLAERIADTITLLADGKQIASGMLAMLQRECGRPGAALFDCFCRLLERAK